MRRVTGTLFLGAAVAGACAGACATNAAPTGPSLGRVGASPGPVGQVGANTSQVSLRLDLPDGLSIATVHWVMTGGPMAWDGSSPGQSGDVPIGDAHAIAFELGGLPGGAGVYTITLSANDGSGDPCVGAANFSIMAGAVSDVVIILTCTEISDAASPADVTTGSVGVGVPTEGGAVIIVGAGRRAPACPAVSSLSASPSTLALGQTAQLTLSTAGPAAAVMWNASGPGAGAFGQMSSAGAAFTCSQPGPVTVSATLVPSADAGCSDGGALASVSTTIVCLGADAAGGGGASACTAAPCTPADVPCAGQPGGVCTTHEALLVDHDVDQNGIAAADIGISGQSCYTCSLTHFCIDDAVAPRGDMHLECDDLSGVADAGAGAGSLDSALCDNLVRCILNTGCAADGVAACVCGTADPASACRSGGANGACLAEARVAAHTSDVGVVLDHLGDASTALGVASNSLACAVAAGCTGCVNGGL